MVNRKFYAYRRLIEAIGYYDKSNPATYIYDPFAVAKKVGLESSVNSAENLLEKIVKLPHTKEDKFEYAVSFWQSNPNSSITIAISFQYLYEWD